MEVKNRVLEALKSSEEPLKAAQIAEQLGVDKKEVDKAIKELKKEEAIHSPKRCFYSA